MDPIHLEDRIRWGLNVAARATGITTDAYRPRDAEHPLAAPNRYLRLPATFSGFGGSFDRPTGYGNALLHGIFDASYTKPGDYLKQGDIVWFIASQERLLPILCVRTNRVISFVRPTSPSTSGVNAYGGVTAATVGPLMTQWPASVLAASREARPMAALPGDTMTSNWTVLLPAHPRVILKTGDLMSDDIGRNGVVVTTELTSLGWRLTVRQATT